MNCLLVMKIKWSLDINTGAVERSEAARARRLTGATMALKMYSIHAHKGSHSCLEGVTYALGANDRGVTGAWESFVTLTPALECRSRHYMLGLRLQLPQALSLLLPPLSPLHLSSLDLLSLPLLLLPARLVLLLRPWAHLLSITPRPFVPFFRPASVRVVKRIPRSSRNLAATKLAAILVDAVVENNVEAWGPSF